MTIGPAGGGDVAPDDVDAGLRRALEEAVVEPVHEAEGHVAGKGEGDGGEARRARHGRDVGQVDGEGLAAEERGRRPVAAEVDALDEAVGGDEGPRRGLEDGGVVADPDHDPGPERDPARGDARGARARRARRSSGPAGRAPPRASKAPRDAVWQMTMNLVTRWGTCAPH